MTCRRFRHYLTNSIRITLANMVDAVAVVCLPKYAGHIIRHPRKVGLITSKQLYESGFGAVYPGCPVRFRQRSTAFLRQDGAKGRGAQHILHIRP